MMWNKTKKNRGKELLMILAKNKEKAVSVVWPFDDHDEAPIPDVPTTAQPAPKQLPPLKYDERPESDKLFRFSGETVDDFLKRKAEARAKEAKAKKEEEDNKSDNPTGQASITQIPTNPVRDSHNPNGNVGMPAKAGSPPQSNSNVSTLTPGGGNSKTTTTTKPSHTTYKPPPPQEDSLLAEDPKVPPSNSELSTSMMKAIRDMENGEERENCRLLLEEAERAVWEIWKQWKPRDEARKVAEKEAAEQAKLEEEDRKRNAPPPPPPVGIPPRGEIEKGPFWESPYTSSKDTAETPVSGK